MHNCSVMPGSRIIPVFFAGSSRPSLVFILIASLLMVIPKGSRSQDQVTDRAVIESVKSGINLAAQRTQTISSDFSQVKELSMIREKIISKGKFYFKKDRMLRWEYVQPYAYLIIIRGDQITVKDDNKVNTFNIQSNRIFREIIRIILGSIRGTLLSDEKNFSAEYSSNAASWIVKLKTLSPGLKNAVSEILISFDRRDYAVIKVEIMEPGGDYTRITFTDRKINQPVDDAKFLVP